jgi:hypothetical protein
MPFGRNRFEPWHSGVSTECVLTASASISHSALRPIKTRATVKAEPDTVENLGF